MLRAYAAQFTVMENANALAAKAIRTCGGQAMLKNLALERIYRDSRCGSLMLPWTAEICLDRLGRESLYAARRDRTSEVIPRCKKAPAGRKHIHLINLPTTRLSAAVPAMVWCMPVGGRWRRAATCRLYAFLGNQKASGRDA